MSIAASANAPSRPLRDSVGRSFRTLRLSLTSTCNFACTYCVPEKRADTNIQKGNQDPRRSLSPAGYAERVGRIHEITPLRTVRLTGGEPLLYKEINKLIELLLEQGIPEVKLTTNAFLLERHAKSLRQAGLTDLNVSLDAVDEDVFLKAARRPGLKQVQKGIEAALEAGLSLKLNATITRGLNEDQILPLLEYACGLDVPIRFLELMRMGHLASCHESLFFSEAEILSVISKAHRIERLPRTPGATANYWRLDGSSQIFGVIANHSGGFCFDCHRLRMDSTGNLYGCLSSPVGLGMPEDKTQLEDTLRRCLAQKRLSFSGSAISMKAIGG